MSRSKKAFIVGVSLILGMLVISACLPNKQGGFSCVCAPLLSKIQSMVPSPKKTTPSTNEQDSTSSANSALPPMMPARPGKIMTGPSVNLASQSIGPAGGIITISKAGDAMNGFQLTVPPNAYSNNRIFSVSSAPITGNTFGKDLITASSLITIDNGGGYSNELMLLRIPTPPSLQQGHFAMPFLYDDKRGELQGMPIVREEQGFITCATRHFTDVMLIDMPELKETGWETGFLPGQDDWQFPNARSYIEPDGQCNGMSLSAMWYFIQKPDGQGAHLRGGQGARYDNNGVEPKTPSFWQDDSLAYRLTCVIMDDFYWNGYEDKYFKELDKVSDRTTWRSIVTAILETKEPQLVAVRQSSTNVGHALVVYSVLIKNADEGTLRVSDPNMAGALDRTISYSNGKFQNYNTALATGGDGVKLDKVLFIGKDTIIDYVDVVARWSEFKAKTIGNVPSAGHPQFPKYNLIFTNSKGISKELKDNMSSDDKEYTITAEPVGKAVLAADIFVDQYQLNKNTRGKYELKPGNNRLGVYIKGQSRGSEFYYVDFKYVNVKYCDLNIEPQDASGLIEMAQTFTAVSDNPPAKCRYEWSINGSLRKDYASTTMQAYFRTEGTFDISVKMFDENSRELCSGQTTFTVKKTQEKTTPVTPTPTPAPTGTGWYMDGAPVIKKNTPNADTCVNFGMKLTIGDGSASGSKSWKDCSGGSKCGGTYTGTVTWTPPPSFMQPGSKINFTMSEKTTAQNTCGEFGIVSWGSLKVDGTFIVNVLDRLGPTATGTYAVKTGSPGAKLAVLVSVQAADQTGNVTYNYTYK